MALGVALFVTLAMIALQARGHWMGPFGRSVASMVYGIGGLTSYALIAVLAVASIRILIERRPAIPLETGLGIALGVVSLATLLHLAGDDYRVAGHGPGGAIGEHLAEVLRALISTVGTALLATLGLAVAIIIATPLRARQALGWIGAAATSVGGALAAAAHTVARFVGDVVRAILPERERDDYADDDVDDEDDDPFAIDDAAARELALADPPIIDRSGRIATEQAGDTERVPDLDRAVAARLAEAEAADKKKSRKKKATEPVAVELPAAAEIVALDAPAKGRRKPAAAVVDAAAAAAPAATPVIVATPATAGAVPAAVTAAAVAPAPAAAPLIVESRFKHADVATMAAKEQQAEAERRGFIKLGEGAYELPSIQLLKYDASTENKLDTTAMLELSARLTQTLANYGVKGDVTAIRPGPVVTMYEFAPAPGTRVSKIANLQDDLAMALEALRVRIVAPIPGKAAVGIEVPNKARETVFLKEIIADDVFRKSKARLPMALGKDIEGGPAVVDLARMPHLLVAGTTGSGKSVAVNAMITSLLYHCSPEDVRLILVDPKMLELSIYEGVPHLLLPVVTDPKKANLALRWAVDEMERRYDLLAQMGVRDIVSYNEKVAKQRAKWEADELKRAAEAAQRALEDGVRGALDDAAAGDGGDDDHEQVEITTERGPNPSTAADLPHRLPFIVVVIDEFADLMMCAPKEVETSVARIAQKARAAGIHLILATQRPSVDVITGLIKANFPSRIAFHVTAKVDSRTILDQGGAEALLGAGDMLFSDRGAAPTRLHGCYVDEDEIHKVVEFLKTQGRPVYNLDILKPRDEDSGDSGGDSGGSSGSSNGSGDDLYDKAVHVVTTTRNASISWVQRQLRIGYNRAARLVEEMEKQGIVSPPDHTNKREVLVAAA
ncbi:MAG: DNA translocase FtsK 4TM domain-containing protein [Kofleriaceae bacterium]|nr:DNA translocase FtsK 4TM domain-containing protein [Kofleriaceae bacterium]